MTRAHTIVVPAGWYPDPLGLPQLRWWDNRRWTEVVAPAPRPGAAIEAAAPGTDDPAAEPDYEGSLRASRSARAGRTWDIPVVDTVAACRCCGMQASTRGLPRSIDSHQRVAPGQ